jgi:hypothetical protein
MGIAPATKLRGTEMKKRQTPSLKDGDWKPQSAPSPFRPTLKGQVPFPQTRDDWDMQWHDPVKGAKVKDKDKLAK